MYFLFQFLNFESFLYVLVFYQAYLFVIKHKWIFQTLKDECLLILLLMVFFKYPKCFLTWKKKRFLHFGFHIFALLFVETFAKIKKKNCGPKRRGYPLQNPRVKTKSTLGLKQVCIPHRKKLLLILSIYIYSRVCNILYYPSIQYV